MARKARRHYFHPVSICIACFRPSTSFRINFQHLSEGVNLSSPAPRRAVRAHGDPVTSQGASHSESSELDSRIFNLSWSSVLESSLKMNTTDPCHPSDDLRMDRKSQVPPSWVDMIDWSAGLKCLGTGSFATVYGGKTAPSQYNDHQPGPIILRRVTHATIMAKKPWVSHETCVKEAQTQMRMGADSLVQCYGYYPRSPVGPSDFWMLMEPMYGGELPTMHAINFNWKKSPLYKRTRKRDYVKAFFGMIENPRIAKERMKQMHRQWISKLLAPLAVDIILGLEALRANKYVHCDIKAPNILLNVKDCFGSPPKWEGNARCRAKFADFGSGCSGAECEHHVLGTPCASPPEMIHFLGNAPASLNGHKKREDKEDLWAAGAALYLFAAKQYPGQPGQGLNPLKVRGAHEAWVKIKKIRLEDIEAGIAPILPPEPFLRGLIYMLHPLPEQRSLTKAKGAFEEFYRQAMRMEPPILRKAEPAPLHVQRLSKCWDLECEYKCKDTPNAGVECDCPPGKIPAGPSLNRCVFPGGNLTAGFDAARRTMLDHVAGATGFTPVTDIIEAGMNLAGQAEWARQAIMNQARGMFQGAGPEGHGHPPRQNFGAPLQGPPMGAPPQGLPPQGLPPQGPPPQGLPPQGPPPQGLPPQGLPPQGLPPLPAQGSPPPPGAFQSRVMWTPPVALEGPPFINVRVPADKKPGEIFLVQSPIDGRQVQVRVPDGAFPGQLLVVKG